MVQGCESPLIDPLARRAPQVSYRVTPTASVLAEAGTLAVFGFGQAAPHSDDPRYLRVPLEALDGPAPLELWQVDATVSSGQDGALRWSAGGGWLFAAIELDEDEHGGATTTAQLAYARLHQFVASRSEQHVLRVWNYLGAINHGDGDAERYKHFCEGRASGMGDFFAEGFPAATAIGHLGETPRLQVYLLACDRPGQRIENPRQVSAWCYPRQYGRTPPSFARAMSLPGGDALAISGTAAVVGHASAHQDDLDAQLGETMLNLDALLANAGMSSGFDSQSPLKAYVRHHADAARVREFLDARLPGVPVLMLHGDICRSELLFEIDGWRYA
ncbi:pteridine-dependent deoxygenase [Rhodanobacter sp. AS-Z3]|uniref:chorismate transformation enzyme, FkbO/Hyg5 family n=1 Tax=Rhodanobacter sp. AS-Z3 TaxID=3031330 RepID=UPI00247ADE08|nr:pteridine-dependent deoxygenase [Rhodanobacter sp. AS-Z3]WEN15342.1 pteridine-dependent deoxygenase [Rhodanobacter sp. AS-Z3]